MADFIEIELEDGARVLFQSTESNFIENHGGATEIDTMARTIHRIETIATATGEICHDFRDKLKPDELEMEIGVGVSGEVGWFFAKSQLDATIKVTLKWKAATTD